MPVTSTNRATIAVRRARIPRNLPRTDASGLFAAATGGSCRILTRTSGNPQAGARGVRPEFPRMRKLLVGMVALALTVPAGVAMAKGGNQEATAGSYLDQLVKRSPAPEYRRYGTAAMANVANWAAGRLAKAGYAVVRDDEATANR